MRITCLELHGEGCGLGVYSEVKESRLKDNDTVTKLLSVLNDLQIIKKDIYLKQEYID
jgi:hypothetical protein